jgi:hypothetical protein
MCAPNPSCQRTTFGVGGSQTLGTSTPRRTAEDCYRRRGGAADWQQSAMSCPSAMSALGRDDGATMSLLTLRTGELSSRGEVSTLGFIIWFLSPSIRCCRSH